MRALALVALISTGAFADPVCLEPSERIALAQSLVAKDAEIASLQGRLRDAPSMPVVVVVVATALVAGAAAGAAVTYALKR